MHEVYEAGVTRVCTLPNTASSSVIGLGELRPLLARADPEGVAFCVDVSVKKGYSNLPFA